MGKCPHCGSRRIRRRYRQHRRYNWRCRRCNEVFRRPKRSVWLWIGAIAVISIAVVYVYSQDVISIPLTPARVDESVDSVVKVVTYTATPEMVASQTLVQLAAPVDTPTMTTMSPVPTYTAVPTHTPRPTSTTRRTRTPRPTYTPRPTTTTPPTPTQVPGRSDLYKPLPLPQGLAYVWWHWEDRVRGFQSIDFDLTIHNDIDAREMPDDAGLYLILFSSDISGAGYYFGLQTDVYDPSVGRGRGKGLIFSRWGTRDLSDVRVAEDGWSQSSGHEGDFVGVRKAYRWGTGDYGVRIATDGEDDEGRWFGLWITDKATDETTWCGSLRFDKSARLEPTGGTAPEIYGAGTTRAIDVPQWHISLQAPVGDMNSQSSEAYINYSSLIPNSDITYDTSNGTMHIHVGATTRRTTEEGWISLGVK